MFPISEKPRKSLTESRTASAFVPAHISGFFQVCDEAEEPERRGSRNCGPCLGEGVLTKAVAEPASRDALRVLINRELAPKATSQAVAKRILSIAENPLKVTINHSCRVPLGAGYGVSGACALGAALALSKALGLRSTRARLVKIAHVAEVECHTGLGDVGPQALGGLVIGLEPGSPPHGRWQKIRFLKHMRVVCGTLGGLSTEDLLHDPELRERSKKFGAAALGKLLADPTPKNFVLRSREFAEGFGLLDGELRVLIEAAVKAGAVGASQVMLGRAVFAMVEVGKLESVRRALSNLLEPRPVFTANISREGATLLDRTPRKFISRLDALYRCEK